jgi:multidrug efflux pump subunit AcrB
MLSLSKHGVGLFQVLIGAWDHGDDSDTSSAQPPPMLPFAMTPDNRPPRVSPLDRAIAWFARNSVAANLLLLMMVVGGLATAPSVTLEAFPELTTGIITVTVEYPGAAPLEVEEGITVRVEEQLYGLEGIKRITSESSEGASVVTCELTTDADEDRVLDEIKTRVDAIDTFPDETEKPLVELVVARLQLLNVAVSGQTDEHTLKRIGQRIRDDIAALPGVNHVVLASVRPYEISIEVTEESLRRHGITFDQVADAVRQSSIDLPGGSIKSDGGEILLRTKGQAYRGEDFARIPVVARPDGTRLTVADVARVDDGFAETDRSARFDGAPAVLVQVFRTGKQSALGLSAVVIDYVAEAQRGLPDGIAMTIWLNDADMLRTRLDTLLRNGRGGLVLILVVLALFLKLRVAIWVLVGIPVSLIGTLWVMPALDVSINVISLFAFILVLGVLVDDAIVVGENIYARQRLGGDRLQGAIDGAREVATPVIFGVLTSMAAFAPLLFVPGTMGKFIRVIPICVISALTFSIVKSVFILPAHLAHGDDRPPTRRIARLWRWIQQRVDGALRRFIERVYQPALDRALEWRYATVAVGIAGLLVTAGLIAGGWLQFYFNHPIEADNVIAYVTLPEGTSVEATAVAVAQLEAHAAELARELEAEEGRPAIRHVMASVGEQPYRTRQVSGAQLILFASPNIGEVNLELAPSADREVRAGEIAQRWRARVGAIPDAVELLYSAELINTGEAINVQLSSRNTSDLRRAAALLKGRLAEFPGVVDITDSFRSGKREWKLSVKPAGESLGITVQDLGRQVRQAFYGEEVQRVQRGRDDVRVMVRYPLDNRQALADIEDMEIRLADGRRMPFPQVAAVEESLGFASIKRTDRRRVISVVADVDRQAANANEIVAALKESAMPDLARAIPGLSYSFEGEQREQAEVLAAMGRGFVIAIFVIYSLLAVPLKSYAQPLLIMTAIPFGFIGAVWGHLLIGADMSMFSVMGGVALAGIAVNDSLVLIDYINQRRREGTPLFAAVANAGRARFRAILLTSLTTFAGLLPLILEDSVDARFLKPMAVSLAFGVLFSSAVSLLVLPATYLILDDVQQWLARIYGRTAAAARMVGRKTE